MLAYETMYGACAQRAQRSSHSHSQSSRVSAKQVNIGGAGRPYSSSLFPLITLSSQLPLKILSFIRSLFRHIAKSIFNHIADSLSEFGQGGVTVDLILVEETQLASV